MNTLEGHPVTDDAALLASPEVSADQACETALNALDDLMVLAANQQTAHLVWANKIFIGQILTRAQLVASVLMAVEQKAGQLKVIRNA